MALILLLAGAGLLLAQREAAADDRLMIGIDMTAASAATASAVIDTCTVVEAGDTFETDIFVTNALDLVGWELRVDYDPKIASLDSADYNRLLTQSGGQIFPSLFEEEKPGRMFMAAADVDSPDSGSGVLARLHWTALKDGASEITIASTPSYLGPRLVSAGGVFFGDSSGDGIWDGRITGGKVAVGGSCAGSVPVTTPPASLPEGATATPGSGGGGSPADGDASGSGDGRGGGSPGSGSQGSGGSPDDDSAANEDGSTPERFVADDQGDEEDGDPLNDTSEDDASEVEGDGGENGSSSTGVGDSGSAFPVLIIAGVFGALGLMVLGTFALAAGRRS